MRKITQTPLGAAPKLFLPTSFPDFGAFQRYVRKGYQVSILTALNIPRTGDTAWQLSLKDGRNYVGTLHA